MLEPPPSPPDGTGPAEGQVVICVVVVGHDSARWLDDCFGTLLGGTPPDGDAPLLVVYVDNASTDESLTIARSHPQVHCLEGSHNTGFGGGCNAGAELARRLGATHLFFLNPDTRAPAEVVRDCVRYLLAHTEASAVTPLQYDLGATIPNHWSRRAVRCADVPPHEEHRVGAWSAAEFEQQGLREREAVPVSYAQGAALAISDDVFTRGGGFDEWFFLFFEEVDLCRRLHWLGRSTLLLPRLAIEHAWGGHRSGARLRYWLRSKYLFLLGDPDLADRPGRRRRVVARHLTEDLTGTLRHPRRLLPTVRALAAIVCDRQVVRDCLADNRRFRSTARQRSSLSTAVPAAGHPPPTSR